MLEPIRPPALRIDEVDALSEAVSLRLENGYALPELRHVLDSGIHSIDLDLRDWTARLLSELRYELERRQTVVFVPAESLAGTSVDPSPLPPHSHVRPQEPFKSLRLWVTGVVPPDARVKRGPTVTARVESLDGSFHAEYSAGTGKNGFSDTLLDLKRSMVRDSTLIEWLVKKERS